jgi:hypothetical protein
MTILTGEPRASRSALVIPATFVTERTGSMLVDRLKNVRRRGAGNSPSGGRKSGALGPSRHAFLQQWTAI